MHGVWKARPKEMGKTRVRGERAVIEADKVANWVRGTTEAASVSFDFQIPGRDIKSPVISSKHGWCTANVTRSGSRRRPRYGCVQEDCGGRLRWPYHGSSSGSNSIGGGSQAFTDFIREKATFHRPFVVAQNAELQRYLCGMELHTPHIVRLAV